jgi:hypothetical protein
LTSKLGGSETHIAYGDPLHWAALLGLALVLLVLVAPVTLAGSMLTGNRQVGSAKNLARASLPEARRHA